MPKNKEIVYPIFLECCQYTEDVFWSHIFEELAYGKTPYGTYINKMDFLCCNYKNKEFSYKIERKDPKVLYEDIYKLLALKLGLLSKKEKMKKRVVFKNIEDDIKENRQSWTNIRKKNVKDTMYEKYAIKMAEKYDLTPKQYKYLLSVIVLSFTFKNITSDDVIFEENEIKDIKGITFEKGKIILERPLYANNVKNAKQTEKSTKCMRDGWIKYINQIQS